MLNRVENGIQDLGEVPGALVALSRRQQKVPREWPLLMPVSSVSVLCEESHL